ncbi:MAG: penicillin acylase family protein, partial [bacterium]
MAFVRFVRRTFPDVRGTVTLAGIDAPVEVLRDEHGVPHIRAETREDMYFAQGYVHAQDRFRQMESSRRVAEEEYRRMAEPYRSYLEAYADGVNAYI